MLQFRRAFSQKMNSNLVSTGWLKDNLQCVKILDASWHMPQTKQNPLENFKKSHIPGAQFFDIDYFSDPLSSLPHMLPTAAFFGEQVGKLGISRDDHVVVYDTLGIFSAPRAWWMFKAFGHQNVSVLDGGFKMWQKEGLQVTDEILTPTQKTFDAQLNESMVVDYVSLQNNLTDFVNLKRFTVLDARSEGRFNGTQPEPREGLRSGHVPAAINVPFGTLLTPEGTMKPVEELKAILESKRIPSSQPIVAMCGSGVTACVIILALDLTQTRLVDQVKLYDGSWTDYASRKSSPIVSFE
ncbi:3-mercaptopyruvate sulfurtransferase-like protein [Gorgonomyces haynaldii]|nr:3-mercaptopyruvate sulfurtransferase-like protein [Gorgonomyces haynaldii]